MSLKLSPEQESSILKVLGREFELQKTALKPWFDVWEVMDYMYRCGQNSEIKEEEKEVGANTADVEDTMANTGSTLFYRQVNQKAAQGIAIERSRPAPFNYAPIINPDIFASQDEGRKEARMWNMLARWTLRQDGWGVKGPDFWTSLRKYGNYPVMIRQHRKKKTLKYRIPKYKSVPTPDGSTVSVQDGYEQKSGEFLVENWPSIVPVDINSLIADPFIPNLNAQDFVFVVSKCSLTEMYEGVAVGDYDEDAITEVRERISKWDGSTNAELLTTKLANQGVESTTPTKTSQWLKYDCFARLTLGENDAEDPTVEPKLYLITVISNDLGSGKIVYMSEEPTDFDPDGEIPIFMVKGQPDDGDLLYHMSLGQALRSNYSVECTLKDQTIDNGTLVNRPPLLEKEGAVRGHDRQFRGDQVFVVDNIETSLKEMPVRDITMQMVNLLNYIQADSKQAASTDANIMGEGLGGRTSSAEATNVYRNSVQSPIMEVNYVCQQLWGWVARKYVSYWQAFSAQGQILSITDEDEPVQLMPENMYGQFDVEVNIADEFEDDMVHRQQVWDFMNLTARNPVLLQHVDVGDMLTAYKTSARMRGNFIRPPISADATQMATMENNLLLSGTYVPPQQGEDFDRHLAIHKAEEIRYRGMEEQYPTVKLIQQHIAETELMKKAVAANMSGGMGSMPAESGNTTPGMIAGNAIAGALGAQQ